MSIALRQASVTSRFRASLNLSNFDQLVLGGFALIASARICSISQLVRSTFIVYCAFTVIILGWVNG